MLLLAALVSWVVGVVEGRLVATVVYQGGLGGTQVDMLALVQDGDNNRWRWQAVSSKTGVTYPSSSLVVPARILSHDTRQKLHYIDILYSGQHSFDCC